jgi:hypothetical protein
VSKIIGGRVSIPAPKLLVPDDLEAIESDLKSRTIKIDSVWRLFHFCILMLQVQSMLMEEIVRLSGKEPIEARQWLVRLYKQKLEQYHKELTLRSDSQTARPS